MIDVPYLISFLKAFLLTFIIELPILLIISSTINLKVVKVAFIANILTLPIVWFIFPYITFNYRAYILAAETFAVLAECLILERLLHFSLKKAFSFNKLNNCFLRS